MRLRFAAVATAAALSLSACAYNGYPGVSVGYGNAGYGGYGGYGYGYDPYYDGYSPYGYNSIGYSRYGGYGYGSPFGWYNGYYYPGTGYYVYDRYRRPRVWNDREREYWVRIKPGAGTGSGTITTTASTTTPVAVAPNWSGFNRPRQTSTPTARAERRAQVRETATTPTTRRSERTQRSRRVRDESRDE